MPGSNGWMERPGPCVRVFWGNLTCGIWASFFNHLYSFLHCHIIFHHLTSSYVMVHHLTSCSILPCNHPTIISSCSMLHLPLSKSSFCFCQPPTLPNHPPAGLVEDMACQTKIWLAVRNMGYSNSSLQSLGK